MTAADLWTSELMKCIPNGANKRRFVHSPTEWQITDDSGLELVAEEEAAIERGQRLTIPLGSDMGAPPGDLLCEFPARRQ